MVNGFRYYKALESVSIASALSTALTMNPCQIRVHQRWQSKLQLPTARKKEWWQATAGSSPLAVTCQHCDTHYFSRPRTCNQWSANMRENVRNCGGNGSICLCDFQQMRWRCRHKRRAEHSIAVLKAGHKVTPSCIAAEESPWLAYQAFIPVINFNLRSADNTISVCNNACVFSFYAGLETHLFHKFFRS